MPDSTKINIEPEESPTKADTSEEPMEDNVSDTSENIIKELEEKLETAQKETKDNYERFVRSAAEFDNYKKRTERQKDELRKYANEALLNQLLPIVDNLERAISLTEEHSETGENFVQGIKMTLQELMKILETFAVKPVDSVGKKFDPKFHQAMSQEISDQHPDNTVLKELQKGYILRDRLLRPAMVIVSKAESQKEE